MTLSNARETVEVPAPTRAAAYGTWRAHRWIRTLLAVVLGVLLALVIAEAGLRLVPETRFVDLVAPRPVNPHKYIEPGWEDPPLQARRTFDVQNRHGGPKVTVNGHARSVDLMVPLAEHPRGAFQFRTNNLGLRRDEDTPSAKPPDTYRILVLGDSHTDGYVDNSESFSTLLESALSEPVARQGLRPEVLNAGVAGYSIVEQFLWYQGRGFELRPDLTLAVFYVGNDVLDAMRRDKVTLDPATGASIRGGRRASQPDVMEGLRLGHLANWMIEDGPLAEGRRRLGIPDEESGDRFPRDVLARVMRACHGCYFQSLQQAARARKEPEVVQSVLQRSHNVLQWLDRDVRADGGRLAVVILPTRLQIEPQAIQQYRAAAADLGLTDLDLSFEPALSQTVQTSLEAAGVVTLPLESALRESVARGPLYYPRDWHLAPAGHRVVAEALKAGLVARGLLP